MLDSKDDDDSTTNAAAAVGDFLHSVMCSDKENIKYRPWTKRRETWKQDNSCTAKSKRKKQPQEQWQQQGVE